MLELRSRYAHDVGEVGRQGGGKRATERADEGWEARSIMRRSRYGPSLRLGAVPTRSSTGA